MDSSYEKNIEEAAAFVVEQLENMEGTVEEFVQAKTLHHNQKEYLRAITFNTIGMMLMTLAEVQSNTIQNQLIQQGSGIDFVGAVKNATIHVLQEIHKSSGDVHVGTPTLH